MAIAAPATGTTLSGQRQKPNANGVTLNLINHTGAHERSRVCNVIM